MKDFFSKEFRGHHFEFTRVLSSSFDPWYHISVMLKEIAPDVKPMPNHTRHKWAPWDAYISTAEPDTLFEEYRSGGVAFHRPIHDNDDNIRGFEVEDADGYILFFGRPNT